MRIKGSNFVLRSCGIEFFYVRKSIIVDGVYRGVGRKLRKVLWSGVYVS